MKIAAHHITVHRSTRRVLWDVTLCIDAPGCTAVVGPNGAGKTTLLQTLLGLISPTSGAVTLDDRDIRSIRRREVARRIAYVPQSVEGFGGFTVEEIVSAARFPHRHPLEPLNIDDDRRVRAALTTCGVADLAGRTLDTLSGGERQKVWIAAALAQDAPIVLLDEPATALDPKHQTELIELMRSMTAGGKTLLVVAHDLNLAAAAADRVIALRAGRVIFDGVAEAFIQGGLLYEVFETPFDLSGRDGGRPYVNLRV